MSTSRSEPVILPSENRVLVGQPTGAVSSWIVPGRKTDPVASFRAHRKLALYLALGVLALGVILALVLAPRTYRAQAKIRVTPTYVASLSPNSEVRFDTSVEYHDYVEQQIYEIGSYATAARALKLLGPKRGLFQRPDETPRRATERLMRLISIRAVPDSYLVTVALEGSDPKATAEVVNAVARAYLERHSEQEQQLNRERMRQLAERKSQLENQIKLRSGQLDQIAQELGTSSFDPKMENPFDKIRGGAAKALGGSKQALIEAQARLQALRAEQASLKGLELDSAAEQLLVTNGGLTDATAELRKQREATFLELRGLSPNHPGRGALEQKIADINAEIERVKDNALNSLRSMLRQRRSTTAQQQLDAAEAKVEQAQREEQGFETQLANLDQKAASFASKYDQGLVLEADVRRDQKEIQDIESRLNSVLTEAHTPGIVQLESQARVPDFPQKGKRRKIGLVFAMLALVLGAGVPTLIDLTDPAVRTVTELEEVVGIPALGMAELGGNGEPLPSRDLLRRIALAIIRERRGSGNRVFVLTSVDKGGGTTSLALALERELTLLGANTAALEANPLSPDPRYRQPRLVDRNSANPATNGAVSDHKKRGTRPQLQLNDVHHNCLSHIVLARPHGELEIAPELLQRLLDDQLAERDIVLLDTPPLLDCADTEMLIQMPAATILIVRAGRDRVDRIKAAAKAIARISPPVVGTVLLQRSSTGLSLEPMPDARVEAARAEPLRNIGNAPLSGDALAPYET